MKLFFFFLFFFCFSKADLRISHARTAWGLLKNRFLDPLPFMNLRGNPNLHCLVNARGDCGWIGIRKFPTRFFESWGTDCSLWLGSLRERIYKWRARSPPLALWGVGLELHLAWGWQGLGGKRLEERQPKNGADEPTGVCACSPSFPTCKASLPLSGANCRKRIQNLTHSPSDLFKAVFSTCWSSVSFKSPKACIIKEGKMVEPLTLKASGIHKPIITVHYHMQILNSISNFILTRLLFHIACCRIPY